MNKDSQRSKMDVKFYCSKHPENELTFSSDLSKVGANSMLEMNVKIVIHPCGKCQREFDNVKNAVSVLISSAK
jgi:hypothetical protein